MENDQTCEVQTMDSPAFGFWGCRGLSLDAVRPVIRPCFSVFLIGSWRDRIMPIGIESDRRSHCSDIELKYGDQKPN